MAQDTYSVQVKNMVDASIASGTVKYIVWSTLSDIENISNGTLNVPFFSVKARVEEHIRRKCHIIQFTFVNTGFYMDNWADMEPMAPARRQENGRVVIHLRL